MTVLTINPSASGHDAYEDGTGAVTLTGQIILSAGTHWAGLLLPGVAVGQGVVPSRSTLFYQPVSTTYDDPALTWYLNAVDNAAVFTTTASSISSRARTTASASDNATGVGAAYRQIDITSIVTEILARPGWSSGNNMALIGDCGSSVNLRFGTYDSGSNVWYVEIEYSGGIPVKQQYYRRMRGG